MIFRGWQKTSLIEYPGRISTVLFVGSCNFRCPFCYNRDLVLSPEKMRAIDEREVLGYMRENKRLYQAVIVTGGEPTIDKELPSFLLKVKRLGLLAGIETNGTNPAMLERLIKDKVVDFVGMDIKAPLSWDEYRKAAGISEKALLESVKKSVSLLLGSGIDYEFRTTYVRGIHDEGSIKRIAEQLRGARRYVLQKFLPKNTIDGSLSLTPNYGSGQLLRLRKSIKGNFVECEVRNV
ncbi:MAG: anaerobic ribonucleoside-triphosphate reductase activating protein [Candidatus Aenigmarchaeota archaeon]|nr:anaerobic ribonucleoside-triphosphate reductase activating protein [Candidatus Aenigmarchaeota archaeon]